MSKYLINGESIEAIADGFRTSRGTEQKYTLDEMAVLAAEKVGGNSGGGGQPACVAMESAVNIAVDAEVEAVGYLGENDYQVVAVDGATYGFALNNNGYYESQNKGVNNSYAICKVIFNVESVRAVKIDCINYAEKNCDYGLISELDTMLSLNNSADTSGVLKNFNDLNSPDVVSVSTTIPAGEHFICIKFRKDASTASKNDSLQFIIGS